jgi:hypothetical protein
MVDFVRRKQRLIILISNPEISDPEWLADRVKDRY